MAIRKPDGNAKDLNSNAIQTEKNIFSVCAEI
jgi:hypothetical protein